VSSNASANQIIVFNASGSYDIDGIIVSYQWDFGDGTTGSGVSPEHVYENPGEYTVTLVITDNNGNTYSKTMKSSELY
jgi:PKD repeat protein